MYFKGGLFKKENCHRQHCFLQDINTIYILPKADLLLYPLSLWITYELACNSYGKKYRFLHT